MSVIPIGSASISAQQQQQPATAQGNWQNLLSSLSGTLGLSTSALQQQLQTGQSLSSIAQAQGVSQAEPRAVDLGRAHPERIPDIRFAVAADRDEYRRSHAGRRRPPPSPPWQRRLQHGAVLRVDTACGFGGEQLPVRVLCLLDDDGYAQQRRNAGAVRPQRIPLGV